MADLYSLGLTTGGAFLIGLLVGGSTKHLFNVFAFIVGLNIVAVVYSDYIGYINIEWSNISSDFKIIKDIVLNLGIPEGYESGEANEILGMLIGFISGFLIGFRFA